MCRKVDEATKECSKERLKTSPPPPTPVHLLQKYRIKGISSCSQRMLGAVSTSLLGQPGILLSQAVLSQLLLRISSGVPNIALRPRLSRATRRLATRAGDTAASGGRKTASWASATAGPVSGRLIASGVELGASSALPSGYCACARRAAALTRTPPRVFLPVGSRTNRAGQAPYTTRGLFREGVAGQGS